MWTNFDTLLASDTSICIFKYGMLMPQKTNFANNLFGATINTFPTGYTAMWV